MPYQIKNSNSSDSQESNSGNIKKNISPIPQNQKNQNVFITPQVKPQAADSKKRDLDNREIADFMKKNDKKKNLNPSKEVVKEGAKNNNRPSNPSNNLNPNPPVKINQNPVNAGIKNIVTSNNDPEANPLKELMRKARAELKNKPKEDVVWMGKEKEVVNKKKSDKDTRFPKVIIVEKEKPKEKESNSSNSIDINVNSNILENNKNKIKKEDEEIYNLNRYLNELAKLENGEEETPVEQETNCTTNANNDDNLNDARDEIGVEETEATEDTQPNNQLFTFVEGPVETDNTMIEELRIELENSLGFEVFKKVYKIVEEKVK